MADAHELDTVDGPIARSAHRAEGNAPVGRVWGFAFLAVMAAAVALRVNQGLTRDLWEDEVIAATHALDPFWRLPVSTARYDVHPFLYFLQLHAWAALGGGGDVWLRLNSVLWNFAAVFSMFAAGRALYGLRVGAIAAGLFAVSAPAVWMAQEVRPYSFMYVLIIWAWFFLETFTRDGRAIPSKAVGLFILCTSLIYAHAIGFLIVFLIGVAALVRIIRAGPTGQTVTVWFLVFGCCGALALLPIALAASRDANLGPPAGLIGVLGDWLPHLLAPRGAGPFGEALAAALWLSVVALGTAWRPTRLVTVALLGGPILLAAALEFSGVRVFKVNVFSTFTTPFFALVAARLLARSPGSIGVRGALVMASALAAFSLAFLADRPPTTGFEAAASLIRERMHPGDVVWAPQQSMFWGMARYLGADGSDWPLQVAPALSERWKRVYETLGPGLVGYFQLEPRTQTLLTRTGIKLTVGADAPGSAGRVWLVTYPRADLPADVPPAHIQNLRPESALKVGFLTIRLYE